MDYTNAQYARWRRAVLDDTPVDQRHRVDVSEAAYVEAIREAEGEPSITDAEGAAAMEHTSGAFGGGR